jgi:hypothetical protein
MKLAAPLWLVGPAADGERATVGLQGEVGGRTIAVRAVHAIRRDGHDDEAGILLHRGPQRVALVAGRCREHDIGARRDEPGTVERRMDEADGDLALPQVLVERPVVGLDVAVAPAAQRIAAGRLDPDGVAPGLGEQQGRVGAGDAGRDVEDAGPCWRGHVIGP